MKTAMSIVGVLALAFGLHWIGQGTGYFTWPDNPMMDNNPTWTYIGAGTGVLGLFLIWFARR